MDIFGRYLSFISNTEDLVIAYESTYDSSLVGASIAIIILGTFAALGLLEHARIETSRRKKMAGFATSAFVLGGSIWSMHFIGMLAFQIPCGIQYNPWITSISVVPGIAGSGAALWIISNLKRSFKSILLAGLLMAVGIGLMHYSGMAAMRMDAFLRYDLLTFLFSMVFAIIVTTTTLLTYLFVQQKFAKTHRLKARFVCAAVMGGGISAIHYVAMQAAFFIPSTTNKISITTDETILSLIVFISATLIIIVALASIARAKSFAVLILLRGFVPCLVIFIAIVGYFSYEMYTSRLADTTRWLQSHSNEIALTVERQNDNAVSVAQTMALAQISGLFGDREKSSEYARKILEDFPQFTGTSFGYEPMADGLDSKFTDIPPEKSLSAAHSKAGRFIPYWYRSIEDNNAILLTPLIDMETSLYYQGTKDQFLKDKTARHMITEPYIYEGKLIVEQAFPIVIDGQFKGIASTDRSLEQIDTMLEQNASESGMEIFLISGRGRIITSTIDEYDDRLNTKEIKDTPYRALFGNFFANRKTNQVSEFVDPFDSERYFYTTSYVPTGQWLVVTRTPTSSVLHPITDKVIEIVIFSMVCFIVVFILLTRFLLDAHKRVQQVVHVASKLTKGETDLTTKLDTSGEDEFSELNRIFSKVVSGYQKIADVCIAVADGDYSKSLKERGPKDVVATAINNMTHKRQEAENALAEAEEKSRMILLSVGDGIFGVGPDGKVNFINSAALAMLGFESHELIGQKIHDFIHHTRPDGSPFPIEECPMHQSLVQGVRNFVDDEVLWRKDGTSFFCEYTSVPMTEGDRIMGSVVVFRDITLRRDAAQKLATAHHFVQDSIQYASRIQRSLLPPDELVSHILPDYFCIWEPKDIVGGDFYWVRECMGGHLIAVADCTGHGVPGAFMTILTTGALDQALQENPDGDPAKIMKLLNQLVKAALMQNSGQGESDDGLELGIIRIDLQKEMVFCGARFSLFLHDGEETREIKGDKKGIGYRHIPNSQDFTNHEIPFNSDYAYYLFSDGITDQIGDARRIGFGKRRLKGVLNTCADLSMAEQETHIRNAFADFQGKEVRRDDVTFFGFRP